MNLQRLTSKAGSTQAASSTRANQKYHGFPSPNSEADAWRGAPSLGRTLRVTVSASFCATLSETASSDCLEIPSASPSCSVRVCQVYAKCLLKAQPIHSVHQVALLDASLHAPHVSPDLPDPKQTPGKAKQSEEHGKASSYLHWLWHAESNGVDASLVSMQQFPHDSPIRGKTLPDQPLPAPLRNPRRGGY